MDYQRSPRTSCSTRHGPALFAETQRPLFDIIDDLSSFYFDTALSSSPAGLPSLLAFAKPGHVMYGTDWPFAPEMATAAFTGMLDSYEPLDQEAQAALNSGTAKQLFPRFA
ncbi:MAG: amidohydrolase family protein [Actinomycetes bacterium]